jgi:hypothetical protein
MVAIKSLALACVAGVAFAQAPPAPEAATSLVNPNQKPQAMSSGGAGCWSLDYNYLGK